MHEIIEKLPTKGEFASALNSRFCARVADSSDFDLSLVQFNDVVSNSVQEIFTLLFRGPLDAPPMQNIYQLEHDTLGSMELFMVPVKRDEAGLYYEAVFNRLVEPSAVSPQEAV
jgi:hypothetical protein